MTHQSRHCWHRAFMYSEYSAVIKWPEIARQPPLHSTSSLIKFHLLRQ